MKLCESCGRDTYPGEDEHQGLDVCEGCDQPDDVCTCEWH